MTVVIEYERNRLRQQQIEVNALVALCEFGNHVQKFEALKHLEAIAYPNKLAEEINNKRSYQVEIDEDSDLSALFGDEA